MLKPFVTDYEKVKDQTYLRMIPGNSPILKDTPHKMIEDMALVVNIHIDGLSDANGRSCVVVSKPLMEMYGIDEAQLFADAEKNSLANEPIVFTPLGDMIKNLIEAENLPTPEEMRHRYLYRFQQERIPGRSCSCLSRLLREGS